MTDDYHPTLVKDRYELLEKLGEGGMGTVYRCRDSHSDEHFAIKFLTLDQVLSPSGIQRFTHEARLLSHLRHPHIVHIRDFGVEDGIPYLIMELCLNQEGRPFTLKELQDTSPDRRLPVSTLVQLLPQILAGVGVLHRQGLIHRDIKPENFLLRYDEHGKLQAKLSDFGLVAITGDQELQRHFELSISLSVQESAVQDRAWVGTYAFMSPEQKRGEQLDARSDVYSLGLIIYRLTTGYERLSPELPSEVNPAVPEWIDFLVERALQEEPSQRWLTALKMIEVLPPSLRQSALATTTKRHRFRWLASAAIIVIVIAVIAIIIQDPTLLSPTPPSTTTPQKTAHQPPTPLTPGSIPALIFQLQQPDTHTREQARSALIARGSTAIPNLAELLHHHDPTVRAAAVHIIGEIRQPAAVHLLADALLDNDNVVQVTAAEALITQGRTAVPALSQLIRHQDPHIRGYAAHILTQLGPGAWPAWVEALDITDTATRNQAIGQLQIAADQATPTLIACLGTTSPLKQEGATQVLLLSGPIATPELITALRHDDPQIRQRAATILGVMGTPTAATPLTSLLKDPSSNVRARAGIALTQLGEPAALPLARLFREGDQAVCQHASTILATIGEPALPALLESLKEDDVSVRNQVIDVIAGIGQPAVPSLIQAISDPDPTVSRSATLTLARIPSQSGIRALFVAFQTPDRASRAHVAEALRLLTVDSAPSLIALLADDDISIRRHAQHLLIRLGTPAIPALRDGLTTPTLSARMLVAEVLVRLEATDTFPTIALSLTDSTATDAATLALASPTITPIVQKSFQRLFTDDTRDRHAIETSIVRTGTPAIPVLIRILQQGNDAQAVQAARLLARIRHPAAVPPLAQALQNSTRRRPETAIAAAEALGQLTYHAAIPSLIQACRWQDWKLRRQAIIALGQIAHTSAIPTLIQALHDDKSDVRATAAEALGKIASPTAIPALIKATEDPNYATRQAALQAIRRIRSKPQN